MGIDFPANLIQKELHYLICLLLLLLTKLIKYILRFLVLSCSLKEYIRSINHGKEEREKRREGWGKGGTYKKQKVNRYGQR